MRYCNTVSPSGQYSCGLQRSHSDAHWSEYNSGGSFRWANAWAITLEGDAK